MRKSHGGKRSNSGRKKIKNKKVQVSFYPRENQIQDKGGIEAYKQYGNERLEIID